MQGLKGHRLSSIYGQKNEEKRKNISILIRAHVKVYVRKTYIYCREKIKCKFHLINLLLRTEEKIYI